MFRSLTVVRPSDYRVSRQPERQSVGPAGNTEGGYKSGQRSSKSRFHAALAGVELAGSFERKGKDPHCETGLKKQFSDSRRPKASVSSLLTIKREADLVALGGVGGRRNWSTLEPIPPPAHQADESPRPRAFSICATRSTARDGPRPPLQSRDWLPATSRAAEWEAGRSRVRLPLRPLS